MEPEDWEWISRPALAPVTPVTPAAPAQQEKMAEAHLLHVWEEVPHLQAVVMSVLESLVRPDGPSLSFSLAEFYYL